MYNRYHDEKFANMGTEEQMKAELASFLAHVAADTKGYSVVRDERHCTNPLTGSDGKLYCLPCKEENYNKDTKTCSEAWIVEGTNYEEFCDVARGNGEQGCRCKNVTMTSVPGNTDPSTFSGYIAASDAYFPRGAIIASWNYDFLGASLSLTGDPSILCDNPDLVATEPQYAWGAGIVKFMEKMQFGTTGETAHKQVMKGNFGGTVEVLYSELECPSNEWTSLDHLDMVKVRIQEVCKAGAALGVYVDMNKCDSGGTCLECEGLAGLYQSCKEDGSCPECKTLSQFVKSEAPTITPKIVESPSWEDWAAQNAPRPASGTCFSSQSWSALLTVGVAVGVVLL
jgi:phage FluMu protein Com